MRFPGLVLLVLLSAVWAEAGDLKWDRTVIEVDAPKGQEKVAVEFGFTNVSQGPVEIRKVQTSCGCTTADLVKKVYQPGESGKVAVVFTVGDRKGKQKKSIVVRTDPAQTPPDSLTLLVNIQETLTFNAASLVWKQGAPTEPQSFVIWADPGSEVKGARGVNGDFKAVLLPHAAGQPYEVQVTPASTERALRGKVCIEVADPSKRYLYLLVEVKE